jgi:hypothetical protein
MREGDGRRGNAKWRPKEYQGYFNSSFSIHYQRREVLDYFLVWRRLGA